MLQVSLYSIAVPAAFAKGAAILAGLRIGVYKNEQTIPQIEVADALTVPNAFSPELPSAWVRFQTPYPNLRKTAIDIWLSFKRAIPLDLSKVKSKCKLHQNLLTVSSCDVGNKEDLHSILLLKGIG